MLLTPAIVGNIISFINVPPSPTNAASAPQIVPFDPLTAAIGRLAVEIAYSHSYLEQGGRIVLSFKWRVLHASICLAFALAEALRGK